MIGYVIKLNGQYYTGINNKVYFNKYEAIMTDNLLEAKIYSLEVKAIDVIYTNKCYEITKASVKKVQINEINASK